MTIELATQKIPMLIFSSLTASSQRGNTLTYNILLHDKELCVQIPGNSKGGECDDHIYPIFVEPDNDVNGYKKDTFGKHISSRDPQAAFLRAIRKSIKQKLKG
jgi:hypothetical protein